MIDSIITFFTNFLNKFNKKNVTVLFLLLVFLSVYSLRANAMNLSSEYASDLEFDIQNIPQDQLYNTTFLTDVPVSVLTIEGNGKSIVVTYVTLVNLISGEFVIDLSNNNEFNSIVVEHYFLPGTYEVSVTIENDVLFLSYARDIRVN